MPKFNYQSFEEVVTKYNLKKVFGDQGQTWETKNLVCSNCNKQADFRSSEYKEDNTDCCCCIEQKLPEYKYISLYETDRCFGGHEEGGWWYDRSYLQESYECLNEEQAQNILEEMKEFANELNQQSHRQHSLHCAESMDWLEARGLDADFLPEPDGPSTYRFNIEQYPGQGDSSDYYPHYE